MERNEMLKIAAERAEEYPAGVPESAWGYGPMAVPDIDGSAPDNEGEVEYPTPYRFDEDDLREFG